MKEYKSNEELVEYLSSKGVIVSNKKETLEKIERYGFVPPFVLVKILTFGVASSYYGLLKQSDRQAIAKYFKISDKLLKQILKNLTTIRNIAAHSDRLYNYTSKFYLSFKLIDETI